MAFDAHTNFAGGSVSIAPSTPTAGTSMTVLPAASVVLPATPFNAVVAPAATAPTAANAEVVRCTNVAGSVWTITRAQESSTARSIVIGDQVYVGFTAKMLTDIETAVSGISLNVKNYGALGDGVTNDTTAIAAALTAATASGGVVYCPPGVYMSTQLTLPANVILAGAGRGATTIKLIAASNQDLIRTANFASLTGGTASGPSGYGLRDITLDANGTNQTTTSRCYVSYGFNHTVDNVWFINGLGGCVYSEWGGPDNPMEALWSDFKVYNYMGAGAVGVDWNGPHDSQMRSSVIATLNSSIHQTEATYGATPINGSTLTIPSNAANGGGGTFTFATTQAADPLIFPTGGGSFMVPTTNSLETWGMISYTSAATVTTVTTFSGCTCSLGTNRILNSGGAIAKPAYGLRINGGSGTHGETGLQLQAVHIWGRNHFGLIPMTPGTFFATNCECEGAFVVNTIMANHGTYMGGAVYGSNGQAGQLNEAGIQIGTTDFACGTARVDTAVFNIGGASSTNGCSAMVVNSSGGNSVKICGSTQHPSLYASPYSASPDLFEAICQGDSTKSRLFDFTSNPRISGSLFTSRNAPAYSASITPNPSNGTWQTITVTNATAFTINAPSQTTINLGGGTAEMTIEILNSSGGAMGVITWNGIFLFLGFTWANPANTKKRYATFKWNGSNWLCSAMSSADY